ISDNQLFIENIESHNAFIQIFDTNGRTVFAGKLNSNNSINIATLHKGLYLLRLHTENLEIQTVKFGKL
ncbi:MAG: T9SS type A sorting domain-containing protein, partial [Paludibacter sp.]|nr:T9SS type A sorting domain-containing protein [Paludibacter sp.]